MTEKQISLTFIRTCILFTVLASVIYPLNYYLDFTKRIDLILVLLFTFCISVSSAGIYHFLGIYKKHPFQKAGFWLTIFAALIYSLAGTVKIATQWPLEAILIQGDQSFTYALNSRVFMAMDYLWKVVFGSGIILMATTSFNHPRTGRIIPVIGIITGLGMVVVNTISFPDPPEAMNLTAMGPAVTLWHLLMAVIMLVSTSWIQENTDVSRAG